MVRTFSGLIAIASFEDRFDYLKLPGAIGARTFGFDRWINQKFYTSALWQSVRSRVIARDYGCDLAVRGREIYDRIYIHHMNPILPHNLHRGDPDIINPEFLITTSRRTHLAIHYGNKEGLMSLPKERRPGDTRLW
jgi:hypothetical protein